MFSHTDTHSLCAVGGGIPLGSPAASGQLPRIGVNPLFGGSVRASGAGGSASLGASGSGGGMMPSGMMSPTYSQQMAATSPQLMAQQPTAAAASNDGESGETAMLQRLMDEINRLKREVGE